MALVCLCHGVTERRVRREIEHGAGTIEALIEEHERAVAPPVRRRLRLVG